MIWLSSIKKKHVYIIYPQTRDGNCVEETARGIFHSSSFQCFRIRLLSTATSKKLTSLLTESSLDASKRSESRDDFLIKTWNFIVYLWGLDQHMHKLRNKERWYRKTKEKLLIYPNLATRTLGNCSPSTIGSFSGFLSISENLRKSSLFKRTDWKMTFPFLGNALSYRTIVDVEPQNGVHHGRHFFGGFSWGFPICQWFRRWKMWMSAQVPMCLPGCIGVCVCACVYVSKWMCVCACVCACEHTCIHTSCIYICAWIILHPTCTPNSLPSTGTCLLDIG